MNESEEMNKSLDKIIYHLEKVKEIYLEARKNSRDYCPYSLPTIDEGENPPVMLLKCNIPYTDEKLIMNCAWDSSGYYIYCKVYQEKMKAEQELKVKEKYINDID